MRYPARPLALNAMAIGLATLMASPAHADTLRDALRAAYTNNPTLEAARAQQRAVDETVPIEKAAGRPNASNTTQYIEFLRNSPNAFTAPKRVLQSTATISVPIYAGGAVRNAVRAAEERVAAGRADLRATESAIFNQVVAAYMDVLQNEALVALAANQVQVLDINLQATSDRFEIGDLTRTDVAQSQSRLALAQGDLRGTQANLVRAREAYIQLVGAAPGALQPPPPLPGLPGSADQAVAIALEANPDIIAARERAQASEYDINAAGASRLPQIGLFTSGNYNNYFNTLAGGVGGVAQEETTANAGVQLTIPIFQGGRPAALQRQAQARAAAALDTVIAAEREVIATTRAAYSSWLASKAIIDSSQTAVEAAALSLEGVRAENSIGNRTILDVLNAEQELLSARVQLVTARRNAYVSGFTLLAAMGRTEARDLGLADEGLLYDPTVNFDRVDGKWFDWDRDPDPKAISTRTVDIPAQTAEIPSQNGAE